MQFCWKSFSNLLHSEILENSTKWSNKELLFAIKESHLYFPRKKWEKIKKPLIYHFHIISSSNSELRSIKIGLDDFFFSKKLSQTSIFILSSSLQWCLVMSRTPFYQTSNELKHHFSNIERTWTCSSFESRTSNGHRTNIEHFSLFEKRNFSTFF